MEKQMLTVSAQEMVWQFMAKHNFTIGLREFPDCLETRFLWQQVGNVRASLIAEELAEFCAAWAKGDMVEIADAIGDLLYVVHGAAVNAGIPAAAMQAVFEEIQASNMTKTPGSGKRGGDKPRGEDYRPPDIRGVLAKFNCLKRFKEGSAT